MQAPARRAARAVARRARRVAEKVLERRYGVSTAEFVYLEDLGLTPEHRVWHDPSDWIGLRRALARLGVGPDDVFVDYGSGLGRAVLVAASLPFRRVIGVEVSKEMTERAQENVERNRHRLRAKDVELVSADALEWGVPPDLTVAYLYCPFTDEIFDGVMQRLFDSVDEPPRPLRIVYNYPCEHSRLIRTGRVRVRDVGDVLDDLFADANAGGSAAIQGRVAAHLLQPLSLRRAVLHPSGYLSLIHARDPELLYSVQSGRALLTRLEGEWWMGHHLLALD